MAKILELREALCRFYGKFEIYIRPAIRFVVALVVFLLINSQLGYMRRLDHPVVTLGLALICTFLPGGATMTLAALLIVIHLLFLSLEAGAVALLLFLVLLFLFFKYAPKNGYTALMTPIMCYFRIPEVVPTVVGLNREPYSAVSIACGIVIYYFLKGIRENEALLSAEQEGQGLSRFTVILQPLAENRELVLALIAFVLTAIVIYVIRRQSFPHAWSVAIGVGNALNLIVLILGNIWLDNTTRLLWVVLGTVAAVIVGFVMEFFLFHLDYARTERVQFQDDEYYYYVKAVPKVYVSGRKKKIKEISGRKGSGITKKKLADEFDISQDLLDD